jgi:hypothetical protein
MESIAIGGEQMHNDGGYRDVRDERGAAAPFSG